MRIIGRDEEQLELSEFLFSNSPEFLAIYGRRRVGKTFLIRSYFENQPCVFFNTTGMKNGSLKNQIKHFTQQIGQVFYQGALLKASKNWDDTFEVLTKAIQSVSNNKKVVLFLDEFPWMSTKNSKLLQTLDYYWNQHWSQNSNIKLIICGSSASWIIDKIVHNKNGLHNRITRNIHLEPFNLRDTKRFLYSLGVKLNIKQITNLYMVMGGIPYYLQKIKKTLSSVQNIELLAFRKKSFLLEEFENLFFSLFEDAELYIETIRFIANHPQGVNQEVILKHLGNRLKGEKGMKILKGLINSNFIMRFKPIYHQSKGIYYKVIDEYTLFYLYWIEPIKDTLQEKGLIKGYWEKIQDSPSWYSWSGYAFESICYKHLSQISYALQLNPTAIPGTWKYSPLKKSTDHGAQIDLLFDRNDDSITVCEIKYTKEPFTIDRLYAEQLQKKINVFKNKTNTNKQIFMTMISCNGIKKTMYSEEMITKLVTLEDLFLR